MKMVGTLMAGITEVILATLVRVGIGGLAFMLLFRVLGIEFSMGDMFKLFIALDVLSSLFTSSIKVGSKDV